LQSIWRQRVHRGVEQEVALQREEKEIEKKGRAAFWRRGPSCYSEKT
jgi:hypothetical protein